MLDARYRIYSFPSRKLRELTFNKTKQNKTRPTNPPNNKVIYYGLISLETLYPNSFSKLESFEYTAAGWLQEISLYIITVESGNLYHNIIQLTVHA